MLKASGERTTVAIASRRAAELYEMEILEEGIEDNPENYTRFLAISKKAVEPSGEAKTSIVFTLKNQPGSLFKAMSVFALRDIDLTKIESRPLQGKPWEYLFYADVEIDICAAEHRHILEELKQKTVFLKLLGSYRRGFEVEP